LVHCGACGHPCNQGRANAVCNAGRCEIGQCWSSWGDCNLDAADGCEVNLHYDVTNCGGCGTACMLANAVPGCGASGCYVSNCNYGWENCDSDDKNGCETEIAGDPKNCGSCGR